MNFFGCFRSNDKKKKDKKVAAINEGDSGKKQQLFQIFKQTTVIPVVAKDEQSVEEKRIEKFSEILSVQPMIYEDIQKLAWNGIPHCIRAKIWKYLLKYISGNKIKSNDILEKKRNEYNKIVETYFPIYEIDQIEHEAERKMAKIIQGDVKRTLPEAKVIRNERIQKLLTRALYMWHIKHPASGYVQGINDLVIPYFLTFLSEYYPINLDTLDKQIPIDSLSNETLSYIQADIYWCISKMLEIVTSNYVRGFGGIQEAYKNVQILLKRIDPDLYTHLIKEKIDLFCLSFREISTFLLRMFTPKIGIRLFDTLISYEDEYPTFILYLLVAIFVKFSRKLMLMGFDELMKFLQQLPTKTWTERELEILISEAYVYKELYGSKQKNSTSVNSGVS